MNTKQSYSPEPEQLAALVRYAKQHGRSWKADLSYDWQRGLVGHDLQQVRNLGGPTWLVKFKLPRI